MGQRNFGDDAENFPAQIRAVLLDALLLEHGPDPFPSPFHYTDNDTSQGTMQARKGIYCCSYFG
jgi:hypothetical protein